MVKRPIRSHRYTNRPLRISKYFIILSSFLYGYFYIDMQQWDRPIILEKFDTARTKRLQFHIK